MNYSIWYKASYLGWKVWETKVTRETVSSVWIYCPPLFDDQKPTEKKELRSTSYHDYFLTAEEAHEALKVRAEKKKADLEEKLTEINNYLCGPKKLWCEPEFQPMRHPNETVL